MGQTIYAVAGYGIILDTEAVQNEDHHNVLSDLYADPEDGIACLSVGAYTDHPMWFIGEGVSSHAYRNHPGTPSALNPDPTGVLDRIRAFLEGIVFEDGQTALIYLKPETFGFHVTSYVS